MGIVRAASLLVFVLAASACATAGVSYSEIEPGSEEVTATSSRFNVLGLTPTTLEELTALRNELAEQCGGRDVTGLVTRYSTIYAIIGVFEKAEVSGYCAEP